MSKRSLISSLVSGLVVLAGNAIAARAAQLPATFPACMPASNAEAREAFRPMPGSPPPQLIVSNTTSVLRLPCNFSGEVRDRASWDRRVNLDLSKAGGIEFKVFCPDYDPVHYFAIYFEGESGWYTASWFPEHQSRWNTIRVPRSEFQKEGDPGGWDKLRTMRISAWKGSAKNTEFLIKDLKTIGELGVDSFVLVLRGDTGEGPSRFEPAERLSGYFEEANLGCVTIDEGDVTAADLKKARLVVLPYNPKLPEATVGALQNYVRNGGKLIAFYNLPEALRPALNLDSGKSIKAPSEGAFAKIRFVPGALEGAPAELGQTSSWIHVVAPQPGKSRVLAEWLDAQDQPAGHPAVIASTNCIFMTHVLLPGDRAARSQLLLAMAGALVPDLWREPVSQQIARIGQIGSFENFEQFESKLAKQSAGKKASSEPLKKAAALREQAMFHAEYKEPAKAIDAARRATDFAKLAYCAAQESQTNEFRAFWCHSAFGVKGMSWDEAAARLKASGFNTIIPNMLWGGAAFYPSKVLPQGKGMEGQPDQIRECLEACRKHGLAMHVWKVNWYLGSPAPAQFAEQMRKENRLQASMDGKEKDWLCPSHPGNRQLEIDSMVELARNYPIDGLHFDYIRYPDSEHCFCTRCREKFQTDTGLKVEDWPALLRGPNRDRWHQWRRDNITALVKAVSEQARAARPGIRISAAVFSEWSVDRDNVAQDWSLWCEKGYMDFVCPMDYSVSDRRFENLVKRQKAWAKGVPYYPGIGLSTAGNRFGPDLVIEQILLTRKYRTGGFTIFNYGVREAQEILPLLGLGITAPQKVE